MSEDDEFDKQHEKSFKNVMCSLAHDKLIELEVRTPPVTNEQKDNLFRSLSISRADYDQYLIERKEREEREKREYEEREARIIAQRENDPKYWKRQYLDMVEREQRTKQKQEAKRAQWQGHLFFGGIAAVFLYILHLFKFI